MAKLGRNPLSTEVFTLGELFPDGSAIERLRDGKLLLSQEGAESIAPTVVYQGTTYSPAPLQAKLEQTLRLPAAAQDFGTTEALVTELSSLIRGSSTDDQTALLIAVFILSTWVVDCLPSAPCLNLWGPMGAETTLIELLSCLCRRPLRLAETSLGQIANIPVGLCPTLVLKQPNERGLARMLAATTEPEVHLLRTGGYVNLQCATIIYTREAVTVPALTVPLLPGGTFFRLGKTEAQQLADRFQPRLLRYRLAQHLRVANSQFDLPKFAPQSRVLARVLGAAVEGAPELQDRIVANLQSIDQHARAEQSQDLGAVVLEALLVLCHEGKRSAFVFEITELANGILVGRHDTLELSPKAVGGILRQKLGLVTERHGPGYVVGLTGEVPWRIHRLAAAHNVLSLLSPVPVCRFCEEARDHVNVHQVHEVHALTARRELGEVKEVRNPQEAPTSSPGAGQSE